MMNNVYLRISDFTIKVVFRPTEWSHIKEKFIGDFKKQYKYFLYGRSPEKIDYEIEFDWSEDVHLILINKNKQSYINIFEQVNKYKINSYYRISLFEFNITLRSVIIKLLGEHNGFIVHASAVKVHNNAYIFIADSGGGKSTIVRLLHNTYAPLADDHCIIRKIRNMYYFYQNPFIEKEYRIVKKPQKYLLRKVFFLKKSSLSSCKKISAKNLNLHAITRNIWGNWQYINEKLIPILRDFKNNCSGFYDLHFEKSRSDVLAQLIQ